MFSLPTLRCAEGCCASCHRPRWNLMDWLSGREVTNETVKRAHFPNKCILADLIRHVIKLRGACWPTVIIRLFHGFQVASVSGASPLIPNSHVTEDLWTQVDYYHPCNAERVVLRDLPPSWALVLHSSSWCQLRACWFLPVGTGRPDT